MPAMTWQNYEQVATHLLNEFATHFGLTRVEPKQSVRGMKTGEDWEIDAKGIRSGDDGFVVVECRRKTTSKLKKSDIAALCFVISDTGAQGGITVSPYDLQAGAKRIAEHSNVIHVKLRADSTDESYVLGFLSMVFARVTDTVAVRLTESVHLRIVREDGTLEERESERSADSWPIA